MAPKQRMNVANNAFSKNINARGNVQKSLKPQTDSNTTTQWVVALLLFVVCGSAVFEIIRAVKMGF